MTLRITRREAIKVAAAVAIAPVIVPNIINPARESEIIGDDWPDFDHENSPLDLAKMAATWELSAQQGLRPKRWRQFRYANAIQWTDNGFGGRPIICWFGIGPPEYTREKLAELLAFVESVEPGSILAHTTIACDRAFGVVSTGRLSQRVRHQLARPAWSPRRAPQDD
jgi:hypothetical protein